MRITMRMVCCALALLFALFAGRSAAEELRISAAASLTEAVKKIVADYREGHPEVALLPNFASSGALARQISAGAPADLYISANPKWMDYLEQQGLMATATRKVLVSNRLVFVGEDSAITGLAEISRLNALALASPKASPAGRYAQQALSHAGLYAQLQAAQKLILAKDVRQALIYAERGEVDGAFVYRTDALLAKRVRVLFTIPADLYPRILYPCALTRSGAEKPAAHAFLDYLFSPAARQVLEHYGFSVAP